MSLDCAKWGKTCDKSRRTPMSRQAILRDTFRTPKPNRLVGLILREGAENSEIVRQRLAERSDAGDCQVENAREKGESRGEDARHGGA